MPRPNRDYRSASKEQYESFVKNYPEIKITYSLYKEIITKWNASLAQHILDTGNKVKIPFGIGPLTITKYKPRLKFKEIDGVRYPNRAIDWAATKKEGKTIYHLNTNTDGMKYYWCWFPAQSYIKCSHIWKFEMARTHSRQLAKYLKNPKDNRKDNYKQWLTTFNERIL